MIPTEIQRVVLLIGMAAIGYLMILAWNDDFNGKATSTPYAEAPLPQGGTIEAAGTPGIPAQSTAPDQLSDVPSGVQSGGDSDVPDASLLQDQSVQPGALPSMGSGTGSSDTSRLVQVTTPTLKVWIDRLGGDVVRVQLPQHPLDIDKPDVPLQLLDNSANRVYVAQSGLAWREGPGKGKARPMYTAARSSYTLDAGEADLTVTLNTDVDGVALTKTFQFSADSYLVDVALTAQNDTGNAIQAALFAQIKRDAKEPPGEQSFSLGPQPYLGGALTTAESRYEKIEFDDLAEEGPFRQQVEGGWIAFLQHYFLSAWVADPEQTNQFYAQHRKDGNYVFGYVGPTQNVAAGSQGRWHSRFYAGPKDQERLQQISENLNLTVDYGFLWWLAVPLFGFLSWLHGVVGNWGVAIILLTFLVKLVLYPLSAAAYKSTANMRRVAPKMKKLQERYSDNRQKLQQEMMELYKKEGVNPLGGCLPMLLPMPIFLALYWVLYESVELRHAPFMLWIDDLAAMDPLFVLPLLMGVSMFFQMSLTPQMGDPMQQRMMKMMPVMFTVLFLFFPAGLVLYWLVNNVLSIAQQWWVIHQAEAEAAAKA